MIPTDIDSTPATRDQRRRINTDNLRAVMCLDYASDPEMADLQIGSDKRPYIFVDVDHSLSLWTHDAATFRRLAAALTSAADELDLNLALGGE